MMKKTAKKGMIPAGYANGGKAMKEEGKGHAKKRNGRSKEGWRWQEDHDVRSQRIRHEDGERRQGIQAMRWLPNAQEMHGYGQVHEGWKMIAQIIERAKALVAKIKEQINKLKEKK